MSTAESDPSCVTTINEFAEFINIAIMKTVLLPQNQLEEMAEADVQLFIQGKKNITHKK